MAENTLVVQQFYTPSQNKGRVMDEKSKRPTPDYKVDDPTAAWEKFQAVAKKALTTPKVAEASDSAPSTFRGSKDKDATRETPHFATQEEEEDERAWEEAFAATPDENLHALLEKVLVSIELNGTTPLDFHNRK